MKEIILVGDLLDDHYELTLDELCRICCQQPDWIVELVDEGVLEPVDTRRHQWRFSIVQLRRAQIALRLQRDLGINLAGIALVLDLLDEMRELRTGSG